MKEGKPFYFDLFHGKPVSYKQVMEQTPNMSRALDYLLNNDPDMVGQRAFDENGEADIVIFRKGDHVLPTQGE